MKRNLAGFVAAGILMATGSLFAKNAKLAGKVMDPERFQQVRSYCIQVQDIGPRYAEMVKRFIGEEQAPNSLVNQLPWKLVDDCVQADAVMNFKFSETQEPSYATAGGSLYAGASQGTVNTTWFQVTAVVSDRSDQKPIYQVQGDRASERGELAVEKTFTKLAKDLKSRE
jgi:hypothetical protein